MIIEFVTNTLTCTLCCVRHFVIFYVLQKNLCTYIHTHHIFIWIYPCVRTWNTRCKHTATEKEIGEWEEDSRARAVSHSEIIQRNCACEIHFEHIQCITFILYWFQIKFGCATLYITFQYQKYAENERISAKSDFRWLALLPTSIYFTNATDFFWHIIFIPKNNST